MEEVKPKMNRQSHARNLLDIFSLKKYFPVEKGFFRKVVGEVRAVDDVSLTIREGETLGLVGESGCGKSTLGKCILRAIEPTAGSVYFQSEDGEMIDVTTLDKKSLRGLRKDMQMIFQDPYSSLDPRMTVFDIISEPLVLNNVAKGTELVDRVKELVSVVGLEVAHLKRYPHAFSGGQRQRIGIARALALNPRLIVADEPVSALDVSVQAQILNLLQDLQEQFGLTYLFISHNLSVVEHLCDRVAVMYVGKIVELSDSGRLFTQPRHPYTEALLSAVPNPDPEAQLRRILVTGETANPADPPRGCYFHPRCRYAKPRCSAETPEWKEVETGHFVACHLADELELAGISETGNVDETA